MPFQPNDILLAFKHIAISDALNATEKQFAAFLVDSYNRRTRRCDPSEETAAHLLGKSTRSIIRAGHRLVASKLFRKRRHGGNHHCNSYEPNWEIFRELERVYKQRRKQWAGRFERPALSASVCQPCHPENDGHVTPKCQSSHLPCDNPVTQTSSNNHIEPTCPNNNIPSTLAEVIANPHLPLGSQRSLSNEERCQDASNRSRGLERINTARAAAEAAAVRRWSSDLLHHFRSSPTFGVIVEAIDLPMQEAATAAESKRRGGGLAYIVQELVLRGILEATSDGPGDGQNSAG
jgi:hypothetical protein